MHLPHPSDGQAMRRYSEAYEYDAVGNFLQLIHRGDERQLDARLRLQRAEPDRAGQEQQPPEQHDRRREQSPSRKSTRTTRTAT